MSETPARYSPGNETHVNSRKRAAERERLREVAAVDFVMGDVRGRHFIWCHLKNTGLDDEVFTGNSSTFYKAGRASVGRTLKKDLEEAKPREFLAMITEHLLDNDVAQQQDEAARTDSKETQEE